MHSLPPVNYLYNVLNRRGESLNDTVGETVKVKGCGLRKWATVETCYDYSRMTDDVRIPATIVLAEGSNKVHIFSELECMLLGKFREGESPLMPHGYPIGHVYRVSCFSEGEMTIEPPSRTSSRVRLLAGLYGFIAGEVSLVAASTCTSFLSCFLGDDVRMPVASISGLVFAAYNSPAELSLGEDGSSSPEFLLSAGFGALVAGEVERYSFSFLSILVGSLAFSAFNMLFCELNSRMQRVGALSVFKVEGENS